MAQLHQLVLAARLGLVQLEEWRRKQLTYLLGKLISFQLRVMLLVAAVVQVSIPLLVVVIT